MKTATSKLNRNWNYLEFSNENSTNQRGNKHNPIVYVGIPPCLVLRALVGRPCPLGVLLLFYCIVFYSAAHVPAH